jgi:hypothetical protein
LLRRTVNLGILAHVDAGKTTLTERRHRRARQRRSRHTQTDTLALEQRRGITIKAAVVSFAIDDVTVNLIDTPGHPDFIAEVERALGRAPRVSKVRRRGQTLTPRAVRTAAFTAGSEMELAGLEPATSWVRSNRSLDRKLFSLQRFSAERLARHNISHNICVRLAEPSCWCRTSSPQECHSGQSGRDTRSLISLT